MIEELTQVPVIGVVPYAQLDIDSEDSVALVQKSRRFDSRKSLDIAIVSLKRLSNFTDFHSLEIQPDVSVRYVQPGDAIGRPDLLILPGSKNTIEDMNYLRESGLEAEILECLEQGVRIFGICGGYQLLGQKISDPLHLESDLDEISGLGILETETVLQPVKRTTQVKALHEGQELEGYEIHMGETQLADSLEAFSIIKEQNGEVTERLDGAVAYGGQVQGTYLHGVFDNLEWTRQYLNELRLAKGLEPLEDQLVSIKDFKDREYDKLADVLRQSLDMEQIYQIINREEK